MTNSQSKLEKLIAELCPNGVELKSIGELCQINRGRVMSKDYLRDNAGEYPVYSSQTVDDGVFGRINTYDYDGEYLTWTTDGANAGSIFYRKGKFSITNVCGLLKAKSDDVNLKFLSYILVTVSKKYVSAGMGNPKIMSNVIEKIEIPIPPLTIQLEIVKILDTFTTLEAELEAELEARKKQYEYYREEMLTFGEDVELKELEDLCVVGDGLHGTPNYNNSGAYYFINGNNLSGGKITFDSKTKKVDDITFEKYGIPFTIENTVLMSINGTIGSVSLFNKEKIVLGKSVAFFNIKSEHLYSKFLFYFLQTEYAKKYYEARKTGSTIKNLGLKALRQFNIPIPSLAEQKRIVAILDKFDALVNDISVGLPADLNARRKQYEYYRGKLLTFEEYAKQ